MSTQRLKFTSDRDARLKGSAEAEAWMKANTDANGNRQRLAQSEAQLAKQALEKAKEFNDAGETDRAQEQELQASFHFAKADRLSSLTLKDLGGSKMTQQPRRKMTWDEFLSTRGQLILPILTIVGVLVLGSTFGAPLWLTLIGAGVAARIVAMRRRSGPWACRFWGVLPTLPMILGKGIFNEVFWGALLVHVLLWPHPTERPDGGQNGQGGQQPPRRI